MSTTRQRYFIALLFSTAIVILIAVLSTPRQREPVYQGKPLEFWLKADRDAEARQITSISSRGEHRFEDAVGALGTNAIPVLLRMLVATESDRVMKLKLAAVNFLNNHHLGHIDYLPARSKQDAAVTGFIALRASASNAVPELMRILNQNNSAWFQENIPFILAFIGPEAEAGIPC